MNIKHCNKYNKNNIQLKNFNKQKIPMLKCFDIKE